MKPKFKTHFPKTYWKEIVAVIVILFAFIFIKNQKKELSTIGPQIQSADPLWIIVGVAVTIFYVALQALMYIESFRSIGLKINFSDATELFLKRNFLSVFLPAGGVSSLAYTPSQLKKKNLDTGKVHQASAIYAYIGLLTVFIVGIPAIIYAIATNRNFNGAISGIIILGALLIFSFWVYQSFKNKKGLYQLVQKRFPGFANKLNLAFAANINKNGLYKTILYSVVIEVCGIVHVYISMYALGLDASFQAAIIAYTISVVLMIISPFLRGLGAVELSMLYVLNSYGYKSTEALGVTILYRVFEFWLPLILGLISFAWRGRELIFRLVPAFFIMILGIVNIVSVATPPLANRINIEFLYVPVEIISDSKLLVLVLGIALIVIASYLIRGLRTAWIFAVIFCAFSFAGHLIKALDYEEGIFSFVILILLIASKNQYRIKSSERWTKIGITSFLVTLFAVCAFNFLCFYLIDKRHFNTDFTWQQSIYHSAKSFLFFADAELIPRTNFGRDFLKITNLIGLMSWLMLIYSILRPRIIAADNHVNEITCSNAAQLLTRYGSSPVDYFKSADDKQIFFSSTIDGFISYRNTNNYACVLEGPVCPEHERRQIIKEFEDHCKTKGLRTMYYRVDDKDLRVHNLLKKKKITIGQEAIMNVEEFRLEGKDRKSLRNGLNSLQKKGYTTELITAPHSTALLNQLEILSDEWLEKFEKREMVFSQGMFKREVLAEQDIIVVKDSEGIIQSFLNIIPDYSPQECTYDLIRRKSDSPGGCMDAMIVKMVEYAKSKNYKFLNLGLVPLDGIDKPETPAEHIVKYFSTRIAGFKQYQNLKAFKEKYASFWEKKYLVFTDDFDLLQIPYTLNKIMKPEYRSRKLSNAA